jgi:hypothetical protein
MREAAHNVPMAIRTEVTAGVVLTGVGIAALTGALRPLEHFSYPVVWWGVLLLLDAWNARRWGVAPINGNAHHFLAVTLPLSVLFWLVYELLNLRFPQWRYEGEPESTWAQIMFGFAAYATVIPIILQFQWLLAGPAARWVLPGWLDREVRRRPAVYVSIGIAMLALPAFLRLFWVNQLMWIAPAILAAPFLSKPSNLAPSPRLAAAFAGSVAVAGIAGGFLWELFNYWSATKWKYLIMTDAAHVFEMPLVGYLGFVPFAFSTVAIYAWQRRVPARIATALGLYAATLAMLYLYVKWYEAVWNLGGSGRC